MNLIDYILDLFRSPDVAASFITDPDGALRNVGLQNVSAAQFQAVAATAAPAGTFLGGGNPVLGLQRAVSDYHGIASPFSPQTSFAPQTDLASHNDTQLASNNDLFSPDQNAGGNAQNGAFNLGFGDITLGDKTSNTATDGGVVVAGNNQGDIVSGDGSALGNNNHMNNGDVYAGTGANVNQGEGTIHDSGTTATGGSTVIQGNEGPVFNDVDASGGSGGSAGAAGGDAGHGGGLINVGGGGAGGDAGAAGGNAGGGGITYIDNKSDSHADSSTHTDSSTSVHDTSSTEQYTDSHTTVDSHADDHSVTGVSNEGNTMDNSTHIQPHENSFAAF